MRSTGHVYLLGVVGSGAILGKREQSVVLVPLYAVGVPVVAVGENNTTACDIDNDGHLAV